MPLTPEPLVQIKENGTVKGAASSLNFTGAGVAATVAGRAATIAIPGGGGGGAGFSTCVWLPYPDPEIGPGTFVVPADITRLFVTVVGPGAPGGAVCGGGPGGVAYGFFDVTPAEGISYDIPISGSLGATWFSNPAELFANAGEDGDAGNGEAGIGGGTAAIGLPDDLLRVGRGSRPIIGDGGLTYAGAGGSGPFGQGGISPAAGVNDYNGNGLGSGGASSETAPGSVGGPGAGARGGILVWY